MAGGALFALAIVQAVVTTLGYAAVAVDLWFRQYEPGFESVGTYAEPYRSAAWSVLCVTCVFYGVRTARRVRARKLSLLQGIGFAMACWGLGVTGVLALTTAVSASEGTFEVESGTVRWQRIRIPECAEGMSASRFVYRAQGLTLVTPWSPLPLDLRT